VRGLRLEFGNGYGRIHGKIRILIASRRQTAFGLFRRKARFPKAEAREAAEHEVRSGVCRTNHDGAATA
jgi:hypothetical protein